MSKLFMPIGLLVGLASGQLAKKLVVLVWGKISQEGEPKPKQQQASFGKLAAALLVEGAVFALVRGVADNASRRVFYKVTGSWPGEEAEKKSD